MKALAAGPAAGRLRWERWVAYSPVLLAVGILLPRLLSPQFGLFDDGYTISVVRQVGAGDLDMLWEPGAARSRPVYWLYHAVLYRLAGPNPFWFFVGNAVLFAATTAGLIYLVRSGGATPRRSFLTGLLFVLAGPVVESYLTLSKPEPLQLSLITGTLVLLLRPPRPRTRVLGIGVFLVAALLLLLADLTKETSLVIVPISAIWLGAAWAWRRFRRGPTDLNRPAALLLASALAGIAFFVLRNRFSTFGLPEDAYAGNYLLEGQRLLASAIRWTGWSLRDFGYLGPLILGGALFSLSRGAFLTNPGLLASAVWMGGWVAVYLPWVYTVEYYLLPFALGASVAAAYLADEILSRFPSPDGWRRMTAALCLGLAGLLLVLSVVNNVSSANQQIMVDEANAEALQLVSATLPASSELLVNLQFPGEYVEQIRLHLIHTYGRPDIRVDYVRMEELPGEVAGARPSYVLEAIVENQPLLTVRMGAVEPSVREWNRQLEGLLAESGVLVGRIERELQLYNVNFIRLLCPLMSARGFCEADEPLLDRRTFLYGWELYTVRRTASWE